MKNLIFVFVTTMLLNFAGKAQQNNDCDKYRSNLKSKTISTMTSGYRNDGSSHSTNSCGTDFSTKGRSDDQVKKETQNLSKSGSFCQYEKVDKENNKQTNYQYQNGQYVKTENKTIQMGVTGSHIHCQKPKKK